MKKEVARSARKPIPPTIGNKLGNKLVGWFVVVVFVVELEVGVWPVLVFCDPGNGVDSMVGVVTGETAAVGVAVGDTCWVAVGLGPGLGVGEGTGTGAL
jgi:hypothetical protein